MKKSQNQDEEGLSDVEAERLLAQLAAEIGQTVGDTVALYEQTQVHLLRRRKQARQEISRARQSLRATRKQLVRLRRKMLAAKLYLAEHRPLV